MININTIIHDLVGVGFGPSNLALAVAIKEMEINEGKKLDSIFLEARDEFEWHPEMQLENTRIQTPFLKDLVTVKNPCSRFSFLNYLKEHDRLESFLSLGDLYPSRQEFGMYFQWAALKVQEMVLYSHNVTNITNSEGVYEITCINKITNKEKRYYAKNVVIACGLVPNIPDNLKVDSNKVSHSKNYKIFKEAMLSDASTMRVGVVGGGQSAGEIVRDLLNYSPNIEVHAISRGVVYKSLDANPFVNDYYNYKSVDDFYKIEEYKRKIIMEDLKQSNYSAIDSHIAKEIYWEVYQDKVRGIQRLYAHQFHEIIEIEEINHNVHMTLFDQLTSKEEKLELDALVYATGFVSKNVNGLLKNIQEKLSISDLFRADDNYQLINDENKSTGIYLQGFTEHIHGMTEGTLTVLAERSNKILENIVAKENLIVEREKEVVFSS